MDCIVAVFVEEQRPDFADLQRSGATEGVVYRRSRPSASGRPEIGDFRDDETLRVSNHLTPRRFTSEISSYMI